MKTGRGKFYSLAILTILAFLLLGTGQLALGAVKNQGLKNPQSLFFEANGAYQKGDYQKALEGYQSLVSAGYESGSLYYNLGNTYFKLGQRGPAVLYYEKARQVMPNDADLKSNLSFALSEVEEGEAGWRRDLMEFLTRLGSVEDLFVWSSVWFFILAGLVVFFILFPGKIRLKDGNKLSPWSLWAMVGCVCVFVALVSVTGLTFGEQSKSRAVAVKAGGEVRFEPKSEGTVHYALAEGARVEILEKKDDWALVKRRDGKRGWVEEEYLGGI